MTKNPEQRWRKRLKEPSKKRHRWDRGARLQQEVSVEPNSEQLVKYTDQSTVSSLQTDSSDTDHLLTTHRPEGEDLTQPIEEDFEEHFEEYWDVPQWDQSNSTFEEEDSAYDDGLNWAEGLGSASHTDETPSTDQDDSSTNSDKPLYDNSSTTVAECLLIIMSYINCHRLSGKAVIDLLKLISLLCPKLNTDCLSSIHKFKNFFSHSTALSYVMHKYCSRCLVSVEQNDSVCQSCDVSVLEEQATSSFIELSIEAQLQMLFSKKGFKEKLNFRFSRLKKEKDNIEDIYDGDVYKKYTVDDGALSDPRNISFTWNTDGVPIFKSSKFSVWPFYCVINELSFSERTKQENMILGGLWFGDSKPSMLTFLKPLSQTLQRLEEHGVAVQYAEMTESFQCKVLTIAGTCDLPAKALVFNTVQFNGQFGCLKCEQPGMTLKTGVRGHVHIFPFQQENPKGPQRTHDRLVDDARSAYETQGTVRGVKGPTWISKIESFDLIRGNGIDYMHCVLLGVMRLLMFLWFSSEFSRQPFSMAKETQEIDKRLQDIQPPSSLTRCPRSVTSHRMFFKASEYRSILLFIGPVVFRGLLGAVYYNHFLLLSEAVFILLMESISFKQIDHAEKLLWNFCSQIGGLYGERYQTANVHLLVHLADSVRALGPLWTHSCFHFEDKNGYLLRLIHGTQNIPMQMVNAVGIVQSLPIIAQTVKLNNTAAVLYTRISNDNSFSQENSFTRTGANALNPFQIHDTQLTTLQECMGHPIRKSTVRCFRRAQVGRMQLTSRHYKKDRRRNNFTVVYHHGTQIKYGQVEFFFTYEACNNSDVVALVSEFESADIDMLQDNVTNGTCFHISPLLETPAKMVVVALHYFISKVVFLDLSSMPGLVFVGHFPNTLERD